MRQRRNGRILHRHRQQRGPRAEREKQSRQWTQMLPLRLLRLLVVMQHHASFHRGNELHRQWSRRRLRLARGTLLDRGNNGLVQIRHVRVEQILLREGRQRLVERKSGKGVHRVIGKGKVVQHERLGVQQVVEVAGETVLQCIGWTKRTLIHFETICSPSVDIPLEVNMVCSTSGLVAFVSSSTRWCS